MQSEWQMREILINNTIRLIAEGGFEKATTRAITGSAPGLSERKLNDAYIYRLFGSKENLYQAAFDTLDKELVFVLSRSIKAVGGLSTNIKERLYRIFLDAWRFALGNEARCRCYTRYYYSIYYRGEALRQHNTLYDKLVAEFAHLFIEEADVRAIMHSILMSFLDFTIRVYNGDLEASENNTKHVFNVLYCIMSTYMRDDTKERAAVPCVG